MKTTCLQENLARAMASARGTVPSGTTLPILTNFLLWAKDGRFTTTAVTSARLSRQR